MLSYPRCPPPLSMGSGERWRPCLYLLTQVSQHFRCHNLLSYTVNTERGIHTSPFNAGVPSCLWCQNQLHHTSLNPIEGHLGNAGQSKQIYTSFSSHINFLTVRPFPLQLRTLFFPSAPGLEPECEASHGAAEPSSTQWGVQCGPTAEKKTKFLGFCFSLLITAAWAAALNRMWVLTWQYI